MYQLNVSSAAQNDADEALTYYLNISESVANDFLETLEALYSKLQNQPHNYSFFDLEKELRSASFSTFPYVIIFQIKNNIVYIVAIHNTRQNPGNILKRL